LARQAAATPPIEPQGPFAAEAQRAVGTKFMELLGFDFAGGRLDISAHPFSGGTPDDLRITTRYDEDDFTRGLALAPGDVTEIERQQFALERDHAAEFRSGFIAEPPARLRRLRDYFAALNGDGEFPPVRCNAPEFSAVVNVDGGLAPCFFIPGGTLAGQGIAAALASAPMVALRGSIRAGQRPECRRCVCSMYREPTELAAPRPIGWKHVGP
jgi:hypothetical protein